MEQLVILFTEEAKWIVMGLCVLTVLLLLIAMRRIGRLTKKIRELAGCTEQLTEQVAALLTAQAPAEDTAAAEVQRSEAVERPEDLIEAVLGEVFP